MSTVQFRLGDMFDGPSDLIVLPCSTAGTITGFVREKLVHHKIPYPRRDMNLGDVQILPFEGGEHIAQFVAYAASVAGYSSTEEAIHRIGVQLGKCTKEMDSVRLIAAPLLGARAGGLDSEVSVSKLRDGFRSSCHDDASLVISILHDEVFERVRENLAPKDPKRSDATLSPEKPPRVFISYSHTNSEHEQWVVALASFLRMNGVEARLDLWHLRHGMDLAQFMTNELTLADRVIIVCDARYAEKADGRVGGVGWETMIVQGDVARLPPESTKYLVVVRSPTVDASLPTYLKTKYVIHWPGTDVAEDNKKRELLLGEIFNVIPIPMPPIGRRRLFL